ncbi:PLP-dependent aminotransferase family protein [Jiangella anatolica]|uniref:PLP-dependent aminotransferase family protein n=1 Tax=Jiangella anatolica TaxID=2670374 RepID=A0A2W2C4C9_9ACTN|nr:PLP-dependent aminotransferase family protein [Jiangella anatolica]PZF80606.1 PLP-dependent aminotransferase family protein [Jiangella anatolica]
MTGPQLAALLDDRTEGGGPAYARVAAAIRLLVLDGRLPLETRLPGERELAAALGVSRTTVTTAYDELRAGGYAVSRQGSGTRTALPPSRAHGATPAGGGPLWTPWAADGSDLLDLAHAAPEAPAQVRRAYEAALDQLPRHLPGQGYHLFGLPELRAAVADRLTARGLPTLPEQVLVTSGAQHAFTLVLQLVTGPGDRVLVEQPTYPNALDAIGRHGAVPVPVPLADDGWDLDAVAAAVRQTAPRLAYLMPDFHNPTGLLASEAERRSLGAALTGGRTLTVVDESLTDLALEGTVPPPLASYLPDDLTVTVGSASKTLWGGLRIGWARAGTALIRRLAAVRASVDMGSPVVEQLAVAELLGGLDATLAPRRAELRSRRDALVAALAQRLPSWRTRVPAGGLVLWCDLGRPVSSRLVVAAERHGIRLAAGPRFGVDGAFERRLRLPFTHPPDVLAAAVDGLEQAVGSVAVDGGGAADSVDAVA